MAFFGLSITQVAGTETIPFLVLTVSSLLLFVGAGIIDYSAGVVLMAGTAVGGYFGAQLVILSGDRWVRRIFAGVVVLSAIRLLR